MVYVLVAKVVYFMVFERFEISLSSLYTFSKGKVCKFASGFEAVGLTSTRISLLFRN